MRPRMSSSRLKLLENGAKAGVHLPRLSIRFLHLLQLRGSLNWRSQAKALIQLQLAASEWIRNDKRRGDMPTSQSNSVLETWTLADLSILIYRSVP
jgi:hypothetical protein